MKIAVLLAALFALGVSACAPSQQVTLTTGKPARSEAGTAAASSVASLPPSTEARPAAPAPKAAPRAFLAPEVLIGRSEGEIRKAFGKPALMRKESPADVWQYLSEDCALHLYFYPEGKTAKVVRHVAINGRNLDTLSDLDRTQCFNDYLRSVGAEMAFAAAGS